MAAALSSHAEFGGAFVIKHGRPKRRPCHQAAKGLRGVWQQRFWEHTIRDEDDGRRHADYIHFNPVRHNLASCPHAWPWSSFAQWVRRGVYDARWCCACPRNANANAEVIGAMRRANPPAGTGE